ncbi:MAG TPA: VTT domain-containing protein [Candidatus Babeliales bacterium]|nr:VTT domain-containing protein [Candidatus Babeliales bacterium]
MLITRKALWYMAIFVAVVALLRYVGITDYISVAALKEHRLFLQDLVQRHYYRALLYYILVYIGLVLSTLPVVAAFTVSGGFLFGEYEGALYSLVGAVSGSIIAFLFFRYLLGNRLQTRYAERLAKFNANMAQYGVSFMLMLHFSSLIPLAVINILASLTKLPFWQFVWTTTVGATPGLLVFSYMGRELGRANSILDLLTPKLIGCFVFLSCLALVPLIWNKLKQEHKIEI